MSPLAVFVGAVALDLVDAVAFLAGAACLATGGLVARALAIVVFGLAGALALAGALTLGPGDLATLSRAMTSLARADSSCVTRVPNSAMVWIYPESTDG